MRREAARLGSGVGAAPSGRSQLAEWWDVVDACGVVLRAGGGAWSQRAPNRCRPGSRCRPASAPQRYMSGWRGLEGDSGA
eukprot:scaffold30625_cov112-Isochrysis_galbana.AAC.2